MISLPIRHGGNRSKSLDEISLRVSSKVLPASQRTRQELTRRSIRLRNDCTQSGVGQERVGRSADTDRVIVAGLVGKSSPLGGLVDGMSLQDQPALQAHRVAGRVVEHHLRRSLALRAIGVVHFRTMWRFSI